MMRKVLILVLLSLVFCAWLIADDYVLGNGTQSQNYVPIAGASNYNWSKFFFTASELQAAGMTGTVQITKIGFQLIAGTWNNYITENQVVYLRESYDTAYPSSPSYANPSGYTPVFSGTISWSGPGWVMITLTNPYSYTYNNNPNYPNGIEILWENRDGSASTPAPKFAYTATSNYSAAYKTNTSSFPTSSGTRNKNRPNIWFMSPATDVPNPAVIVSPTDGASDVAIDANLIWSSGGGDPSDYLFSLWKTDPLVTLENNLVTTSNSYNPAFYFDYSTTYYWRVVPRNSFGPALACPTWSFTTVADPSITTFPWTENFDGANFPPNSEWQIRQGVLTDPVNLTPSSIWDQDDWLNIAGTDQAAAVNIWGTITNWLITPLLNITDDSQSLIFDLAFLKYNQPPTGIPPALTGVDDRFAVLIGDGFTWSTANIVREWNNSGSEYVLNELSPWGQRITIPLTGHTGHIRIAFYAGSTLSNADNDFMINNLFVGSFLAEPEVSVAYNHDLNSCILSWNAVSDATGYDVYCADSPNGTWDLLGSTADPGYTAPILSDKRFYRVVATKP